MPLSHLYKKANTHASPSGTEMLYQGVPLESKAAPNTDAIGNKVCFTVLKGAGIQTHEEICPELRGRLLVTCTVKGAAPFPVVLGKEIATGARGMPPQLSKDAKLKRLKRLKRHERALTLFSFWSL